MKHDIMLRDIFGSKVGLRTLDGYVNATQLIKAYQEKTGEARRVKEWLATDRAKAYVELVSKREEICPSALVEVRRGKGGGTWIHPKLATPFATWLDVEFEFQVSEWVQGWMATGQNPIAKVLTREEIIASLMPALPKIWKCRYTPDFWSRLETHYGIRQGNPACAIWINRFVYGYFPQEVRDRLDAINPLINGQRLTLQHQHFDGELLMALEQHLVLVFGYLEVAIDAADFQRMMDGKFKGIYQLQLWRAA